MKSLSGHVITQIACGETFTLFLTKENRLFVTGMLECVEDTFDSLKHDLGVPHEIPFNEEIVKISAGTRFALVVIRMKFVTIDSLNS